MASQYIYDELPYLKGAFFKFYDTVDILVELFLAFFLAVLSLSTEFKIPNMRAT